MNHLTGGVDASHSQCHRRPQPRPAGRSLVDEPFLQQNLAGLAAILAVAGAPAVAGAASDGYLNSIHHFTTLTTTVPDNGDQNPYAIVVAPVSAGTIKKDDVLIDNFNDHNNLQGLGSTIVDLQPSDEDSWRLFASIPRHLPQCPGGVGLTTAMTMLKSGWVIVGSLPSQDGTTGTKGPGCLVVLDSKGNVAATIAGPNINGPWGNMAVIDNGTTATLFVSNTGFGVGAPGQDRREQGERVRLNLSIPPGKPPTVRRSDNDRRRLRPAGRQGCVHHRAYRPGAGGRRDALCFGRHRQPHRSDPGRRNAQRQRRHRPDVTKDGLLQRPLAMAIAPNGNLLVTNGLNGQVVEIDPVSGKQLYALWVDANRAQSPPGSGDLFGIAMTPAGDGFYYVEDEMNTLVLAR